MALAQPRADLTAQYGHLTRRVRPLAMNDDDHAISIRAALLHEGLDRGTRLDNRHSMQIEAPVDRECAAS
jgi:hypothetical protein